MSADTSQRKVQSAANSKQRYADRIFFYLGVPVAEHYEEEYNSK